jgi:hypothetical protein
MAMMPPTIDLTEEQKTWVDDMTQVLTTTKPSLHLPKGRVLPFKSSPTTPQSATYVASEHFRVPHFSRIFGGSVGDFTSFGPGPSALVAEASVEKSRRERRRALVLPREHGAWGLLLVPMVTGAGIAFRETFHVVPFLLLLTSAVALFWLRTPLESLIGTSAMRAQTKEERSLVMSVIAALGGLAVLTLSTLLWEGQNPFLWVIGAVAGLAFVAQSILKDASKHPGTLWRRQPRSKQSAQTLRMISEIVGTIGLTSAAPAAYYVITGKFDAIAVILWIANLMFAGNQIHYVQLRIHSARIEGLRAKFHKGWAFAAGQTAMTLALTFACVTGLLPRFTSVAFAPLLFRGWFYFIQKPAPLAVRRLGWNELTQAIVFSALFIATFNIAK